MDSSVLITAERNGESVKQSIARVFRIAGNQEVAMTAISLVASARHLSRQHSGETKGRQGFIDEILATVPFHAFTPRMALLAGRIDGEQQATGVNIPFQDLLIGVIALDLNYPVVTGNPRHFRMIPNLSVVELS